MAEIMQTTLQPGKLELIAAWLPGQAWYRGGGTPELSPAGGFRLDDPAGAVGIEFIFTADASGDQPIIYQVPLTYRNAALDDSTGLVGTTEHGVLGTRWVYDAAHDRVAISALLAAVQGRAVAQMQRQSFTADPSVIGRTGRPGAIELTDFTVTDSPEGTSIAVVTAADERAPAGNVAITVLRVLGDPEPQEEFFGQLDASWMRTDGTVRGGPVALIS